jgi:hypothetical protein
MRSNVVLWSFVFCAASVQAQPPTTFSSGSTGVDGPLTYAANLGTVYFPPAGLAQRANNIYNFTTVTIGDGTTVRLSGWIINGPLYWLAQGDVTISGTLDISGQPGHPPNIPNSRAPNEPGAGGYSGGLAHGAVSGQNATAGSGPGGGQVAGYDQSNPDAGGGGTFTGNNYLQPLTGGSGGGGGCRQTTVDNCAGGGAGGGAILIASSTQITIAITFNGQFGCRGGVITAAGGSGSNNYGGGGSGGAIRLVANAISSQCHDPNVSGGKGVGSAGEISSHDGGPGIIRLEGFTVSGAPASAIVSKPVTLVLPVGGPPTVSVTSISNIAINANPFTFPDVAINTGSPVPVVISGTNIPNGTTGNLCVFGETTPDQTIPFTLTGTLQSTSATINVAYPAVGSRGFARVTWTGH